MGYRAKLGVTTAKQPGLVRLGMHGRVGEVALQRGILAFQLFEPVKHVSLHAIWLGPDIRSRVNVPLAD